MPYNGCFGYGFMGGNYIFSWIFMILLTIALVLFIIWIIKKIQEDSYKNEHINKRRRTHEKENNN